MPEWLLEKNIRVQVYRAAIKKTVVIPQLQVKMKSTFSKVKNTNPPFRR